MPPTLPLTQLAPKKLRIPMSARGRRTHTDEKQTGSLTERDSHMEAFYKTRYCRYFTTQGSCWKGDDCQFAHSESELRSPPDLTKTRMCAMFRLGYCKLSAQECTFAHSLEDLKATDNFYKTEICSFWANGFCRAGEACRHAHGDAELRPRPQLTEMKTRKISEFKKEREEAAAAAAAADSKAESKSEDAAPTDDKKWGSCSTSSDDAEWTRQNPTPVTTARSESSLETSSTVSSYAVSAEEPPTTKVQTAFYCVPPLFFPWPMPATRRLVGIPVDNVATNEGLHQDGFCLGVPSVSPKHVALGLPVEYSCNAVIERPAWVYC